jgi:hypothetical protein
MDEAVTSSSAGRKREALLADSAAANTLKKRARTDTLQSQLDSNEGGAATSSSAERSSFVTATGTTPMAAAAMVRTGDLLDERSQEHAEIAEMPSLLGEHMLPLVAGTGAATDQSNGERMELGHSAAPLGQPRTSTSERTVVPTDALSGSRHTETSCIFTTSTTAEGHNLAPSGGMCEGKSNNAKQEVTQDEMDDDKEKVPAGLEGFDVAGARPEARGASESLRRRLRSSLVCSHFPLGFEFGEAIESCDLFFRRRTQCSIAACPAMLRPSSDAQLYRARMRSEKITRTAAAGMLASVLPGRVSLVCGRFGRCQTPTPLRSIQMTPR